MHIYYYISKRFYIHWYPIKDRERCWSAGRLVLIFEARLSTPLSVRCSMLITYFKGNLCQRYKVNLRSRFCRSLQYVLSFCIKNSKPSSVIDPLLNVRFTIWKRGYVLICGELKMSQFGKVPMQIFSQCFKSIIIEIANHLLVPQEIMYKSLLSEGQFQSCKVSEILIYTWK